MLHKRQFSCPSSSNSKNWIQNDKDEIKILRKLTRSKFPIYLVFLPNTNQTYVIKVFEIKNQRLSSSYLNETRFSSLKHPHVVSIVKAINKVELQYKATTIEGSCIMMEYARCDFGDLIQNYKLFKDEKLVRTFFHQLVEGLEYLHSQGVYHLDIKPENLLLGNDFKLKITDFDTSTKKDDESLKGRGTDRYRAPELANGVCKSMAAADIYSLGTTLFAMKAGYNPYLEDQKIQGFDLQDLLFNDPDAFWKAHKIIEPDSPSFKDDFKLLFLSLVARRPENRASFLDIKNSEWYKKSIYNQRDLQVIMKSKLGLF